MHTPFNGLSWSNMIRRLPLLAAAACLCAGLTLFLPHFQSWAQNRILGAVTLTPNTEELLLNRYTILQRDPEGIVTPETIRRSQGAILSGTMPQGDMLYLGYDGISRWLSVKLQNKSDETNWVIDLGRRTEGRIGPLAAVSVYELTVVSDTSSKALTPTTVNLKEIEATNGHGVYRVDIAPQQEKLVLLNITGKAGSPALVPLRIYSQNAYLEHIQARSTINTLYALILGGLGIYFACISTIRRKPLFGIFSVYFIYLGIGWIMYDTIGSIVGSGFSSLLMTFMFLGFSLLLVFMTKIFCGIEYGNFSEKYILYGLAWVSGVSALLSALLPASNNIIHSVFLYGPPMFTLTGVCLMSLAQARSGLIQTHMFFYSLLAPVLGFCVTMLTCFGVLPQHPAFINMFWFCLVIQGGLMVIAVNQRLAYITEDEKMTGGIGQRSLNLDRLKETKDIADHTRLLKVIERERDQLAEFRAKEAQRTEEMRKAKEEADEANRAKSAFLAVVSHEIRTPMTGIMGMVRLLLDSSINKQQRDYAMTIQESSEAMLALLNDILDFEKIQRGKIDLENISFDLHRLIQGIITLMSGHAAEKGIVLSARIDDNLPKFVKSDPTRLRQILLNLMGNGIKFTEKGSVTLLVKTLNPATHDSAPVEKHMIYFAVQDTGIGIPSDEQKTLFNPFSQANSSITRKFGGSGLGLAISKGLIERMGSSVNINSKEGEGSTFFFTLEMEKGLSISQDAVNRSISPPEDQGYIPPLKILLVDDNVINRKVVAGFLESGKHEIVGCSSADEALDKINRYAFDMVLMDIELPGIKGNEATKILREHGDRAKSQIPVIAMTGNVSREDKEKYLTDGMNGFLAKPIDPDKLRAIVNEIAMKSFEREIKAPGGYVPKAPETSETNKIRSAVNYEGVFNPEMLQSLKDTIGSDSLMELLNDLIVKTDEILIAMDLATQGKDWESLAARAHELKGMAGNFGLVEISSIAAQAERKAKNNEEDGIDSLVATLPEARTRARGVLKDWVEN
jgi:signal transduction histidine kinase/CheY-like chemotaxis protein/HPt (histidine-containing phosphotransfer) domain-containing protein